MAFDLETIRSAAQRVAASHGLDVVDVEMAGGGKHRALRIFIEKNAEQRAKLAAELAAAQAKSETAGPSTPLSFGRDDSGEDGPASPAAEPFTPVELKLPANMEALSCTTHEDCAAFSHDFGVLLDIEDLVPGSAEYTLEVSSPGLDRTLRTPADFARFTGNLAKVQTRIAVNGNRHWNGRLLDVSETSFTLDLSAMKLSNRNKPAKSSKKTESSKASKKTAAQAPEMTIRLDIANVEKASLIPEI